MPILSLFPGIDLLGRGFELEGFCVAPGPDLLWGGDIRSFHPPAGRFDGAINLLAKIAPAVIRPANTRTASSPNHRLYLVSQLANFFLPWRNLQ